jgi:hypothetical protein
MQDLGSVLQALPGFVQIINIIILFGALFFFTSTLASHLIEAWVGMWNSRGKQLRARLENALGKTVADEIYGDPLIRSISTLKKRSPTPQDDTAPANDLIPPSYIEPELFARVVNRLSGITNNPLAASALISDLKAAAGGAAATVEPKIIDWFKSITDHQTGVYTRWTFLRLIVVGFLFALAMDLDTVHIAGTLWQHPEQAERAVKALQDAAPLSSKEEGQLSDDERKKLQSAVADAVQELRKIDPPNYAWQNPPKFLSTSPLEWDRNNWVDLLAKLLGWFLTALATSLGAQFWFNLMSEALKLRAAGRKPS